MNAYFLVAEEQALGYFWGAEIDAVIKAEDYAKALQLGDVKVYRRPDADKIMHDFDCEDFGNGRFLSIPEISSKNLLAMSEHNLAIVNEKETVFVAFI